MRRPAQDTPQFFVASKNNEHKPKRQQAAGYQHIQTASACMLVFQHPNLMHSRLQPVATASRYLRVSMPACPLPANYRHVPSHPTPLNPPSPNFYTNTEPRTLAQRPAQSSAASLPPPPTPPDGESWRKRSALPPAHQSALPPGATRVAIHSKAGILSPPLRSSKSALVAAPLLPDSGYLDFQAKGR